MHVLLLSVLALTNAPLAALPGSPVTGDVTNPADSSEEAWLSLDDELESLGSELALQGEDREGPRVGAVMRLNYSRVENLHVPPANPNEVGGFIFDNVRLWVEGSVGDFDVKLQAEAAVVGVATTPIMIDAYVSTQVHEQVRVTAGQFLRPFLGSSLVEPQNLLFILRTSDAQFWHARALGLMVDGSFDRLRWAAMLDNGGDGAGDDLAYSVRVVFDAMGAGVGDIEGYLGAPEGTNISLSAGFHDDQSAAGDGEVFSVEGSVTCHSFYGHVEFLDYADDGGAGAGIYSVFSDTSPFSVVASYMVVPDKYEVGARFQSLDDPIDTTSITLGVTRYLEGRNLMMQLNVQETTADGSASDTTAVGLGLTASI